MPFVEQSDIAERFNVHLSVFNQTSPRCHASVWFLFMIGSFLERMALCSSGSVQALTLDRDFAT